MKVGILGTRGIPNNYGGFEQFAQSLSVGLVHRGHEVYVYNSSRHLFREKKWNGVNIIHCRDRENKVGTAGQFLYDLRCNRDAARRNFDVLFHLGYSSDSIWWRNWPSKTCNIVNMDGLEWKRTKYNSITRKFLKKAEAWAAMHADNLIADSPAMASYISKTYGKTAAYIPYGAELFDQPNASILSRYELNDGKYFLAVARIEPENNIEMIIQGWINSANMLPLIVVGSVENKLGQYLVKKYAGYNLKFLGSIYDQEVLNNLRAFSKIYFHGHSVGGTNPSLLEAMACGCNIAAHNNKFNKAILDNEAAWFTVAEDVSKIINATEDCPQIEKNIFTNLERIRRIYNPVKIIDAYEQLMYDSKFMDSQRIL